MKVAPSARYWLSSPSLLTTSEACRSCEAMRTEMKWLLRCWDRYSDRQKYRLPSTEEPDPDFTAAAKADRSLAEAGAMAANRPAEVPMPVAELAPERVTSRPRTE